MDILLNSTGRHGQTDCRTVQGDMDRQTVEQYRETWTDCRTVQGDMDTVEQYRETWADRLLNSTGRHGQTDC